jgi:ABC-type amino acid transport substrate-binding protein
VLEKSTKEDEVPMKQIVLSVLFCCTGVLGMTAAGVDSASAPHAAAGRDANGVGPQAQRYLQGRDRTALIAHVNTSRPMAFQDENGVWIGLEMGQIRAVCEMMDVQIEFQPIPDPNDRFAGLRDGSADIVFGGLSITSGRMENGLDFSQATLGADLCTVSAWDKGTAMGEGLFSILYATLDGKTILMFLIVFPLAVKVVRSCRHQPEVPSIQLGFLITCLVFLFGVFFLCVTQDRIRQAEAILDYYSDDDLAGRHVATKINTTSEKTAYKKRAVLRVQNLKGSFDEAFALLQDKTSKVEFVIADFPIAAHYVNKGEGKGKSIIIGPRYNPQNYGAVFRQGDTLLRDFNIALLKVQESELYEELTKAYLGDISRVR